MVAVQPAICQWTFFSHPRALGDDVAEEPGRVAGSPGRDSQDALKSINRNIRLAAPNQSPLRFAMRVL